ncbi:hypothetical protein Taro_053807 [Colocasia esculenta]|uniref:Uncharacterized protein n=1 Tax=Colocasia esculenta TaxID=4460 RepID=A0A843XM73_COLES|nr:hypothetical protein [Colocasia esculenta]
MWVLVRTAIGTTRKSPIQNRHFDPDGTWSDSGISNPLLKFLSGSMFEGCRCDQSALRDARRPLIAQAIRRRSGVEKPSFRTLKLRFRPTISPFLRFSRSNVSLDHVNPGRGNHTESACHGDQKLCSTRRKNSCRALRDGRQDVGFVKFPTRAEISLRSVPTSTPIVIPLG